MVRKTIIYENKFKLQEGNKNTNSKTKTKMKLENEIEMKRRVMESLNMIRGHI
jgi:hypothetical protein